MNILMFSRVKIFDEHLRGGAKRFYELYSKLKEKNHNVEMCTVDVEAEYKKRNIDGFVFPRNVFNKRRPLKAIYEILKVTKDKVTKIKNSEYDKIIVFGISSAIVLSIYGVKNIYLFLRDDLIGYRKVSMGYPDIKLSIKNRIYLVFLNIIEGISIRKCKTLVVQCNHDLMELKRRHKSYGVQLVKKTIIQINNVNPSWIVESSSSSSMNLEDSGKTIVGFIGNFNNEQKGNRLFLEAVCGIDNPEIEFYVGGTGKSEKELQRRYSENDNIHFCGWLSNPCAFIKACDLIVVPSLADSCPNTVMEALYCGVPVIGSNRGGIPDILNNTRWIFNPDVKSIRDAIQLLSTPDQLRMLRFDQQRRKVELEFDWADKIIDILS